MADELINDVDDSGGDEDVEIIKAERDKYQRLVDKYSAENKDRRKTNSELKTRLEANEERLSKVLSALNLDADDEEFEDRLAELASGGSNPGGKPAGDDDAEKRGYQKAKNEFTKQIRDLENSMKELQSAAEDRERLRTELNDGKINRAIRKAGLDLGVDPKKVERFVKNVRLDYSNFEIDDTGGIYFHSEGSADDGADVEAITGKFLGTEDGKMFVPQNVKPGLGSHAGGSSPSKPITRESIDMNRAAKDEAYRQEIYDKLQT